MSFPVTPQMIKEVIPSPGGSFCEKFLRGFKLGQLFYEAFKFVVGEDGKITPEAAALFCSLNCSGTGTGGVPGAPIVMASDGTFLNKVQITWTGVPGSSSYEVFRNNINSTSTASIIGTTVGNSFDDITAVAGTTYYYWVRAKTGSVAGPFSAVDTGFAAIALAAVTDLDATKGFHIPLTPTVALVWTPVAGASSWDIYRNTVDDFATATKIGADRVPFDNSESLSVGPSPTFIDNGGELVYYDSPSSAVTVYYYWVVGKATGSIGAQSNSASGWGSGWGDGSPFASYVQVQAGAAAESVAGYTSARIVVWGAGGNGAGSGGIRGGGGAGVSSTVYGVFTITGGTPKFRVVSTPASAPARSTSEVDGTVSPQTVLQFAPDGTTWAAVATSDATLVAATYEAASNGIGGSGGATGSVAGGVTDSAIVPGRAGKSANGNKGGRSGYAFGGTAKPGAHFDKATQGIGFLGDGSASNVGASGAYADPSAGALREGGRGGLGFALIFLRS